MKRLLRSQMCRIVLIFEDLATKLGQIEQILISRPLTPLSTDPNDVQVLTPGESLILSPLIALPSSNENDIEVPGFTTLATDTTLVAEIVEKLGKGIFTH